MPGSRGKKMPVLPNDRWLPAGKRQMPGPRKERCSRGLRDAGLLAGQGDMSRAWRKKVSVLTDDTRRIPCQ